MAVFERSDPNSFSGAHLRLPARFFSALNRAAALRDIPREDLPPVGSMIEEHARALQEETEVLRERLKNRPRLPAREGEARVLHPARELLREEQAVLTPGLILQKARAFWRDQLEPYVFCGDVSAGQNAGRGCRSWYTGSAAWIYYIYFTCLLGFEKRGDKARLRPHARHEQEEYTVAYRFGQSLYHFTASPDVFFPTLDGEKLPDGWAALCDDGRTHDARFPLH